MKTNSFDPQALTSLTGKQYTCPGRFIEGFDPQALTSLTYSRILGYGLPDWFRSTGSYEPDHKVSVFG